MRSHSGPFLFIHHGQDINAEFHKSLYLPASNTAAFLLTCHGPVTSMRSFATLRTRVTISSSNHSHQPFICLPTYNLYTPSLTTPPPGRIRPRTRATSRQARNHPTNALATPRLRLLTQSSARPTTLPVTYLFLHPAPHTTCGSSHIPAEPVDPRHLEPRNGLRSLSAIHNDHSP